MLKLSTQTRLTFGYERLRDDRTADRGIPSQNGTPFNTARSTFFGDPGPLLKSPFRFRRYGQSGTWVCERLPNLARCVDDISHL